MHSTLTSSACKGEVERGEKKRMKFGMDQLNKKKRKSETESATQE